jgi:hypothetical protein
VRSLRKVGFHAYVAGNRVNFLVDIIPGDLPFVPKTPDGGDDSEKPDEGEDHETEEVVDSGTLVYVIEEDIILVSKHVDPRGNAAVADKTNKMAGHQTAQNQTTRQMTTARMTTTSTA